MDPKLIEELRKNYSKNPPKGLTAALVRNMTDSDLLDMHYFLIEADHLDGLFTIYVHTYMKGKFL